jgi:hemolysin III
VGDRLLLRVGAGAAAGVVASFAFPHIKPLAAAIYVALGWAAAPDARALTAALPPGAGALIVGGGVVYTVGALTYALKWPNPRPRTFGYHEVFHALVVLAAGLHFAAVHMVAHAHRAG